MKTKSSVYALVLAAFFLALGLVLPIVTGHIPTIGKALSPMHIPVLICGFVLGWKYGGLVGLICPLLRSVIFGMPQMYPTALAMAFELAAYGILAGVLFGLLKKAMPSVLPAIYISLILAMLGGRLVWGLASLVLYGLAGNPFTMEAFLAGAFINAVPGIVLHIILIPPVVLALYRAGVFVEKRDS